MNTVTRCPKCAYERKPTDTAPGYECPSCGVIYAKYKPRPPSAAPTVAPKVAPPDAPSPPASAVAASAPVEHSQHPEPPMPTAAARPRVSARRPEPADTEPAWEHSAARAQNPGDPDGNWFSRAGGVNRVAIGALVLGLGVGYIVGREHVKYEIRSVVQGTAGQLAALFGGGNSKPFKPAQSDKPEKDRRTRMIPATLIDKAFSDADKFQSKMFFDVQFDNRTGKAVRAFDGRLIVTDLLGNEIISVQMSVDDPVAKGGRLDWSGTLKVNPYVQAHEKFKNIEMANMKTFFRVGNILFEDGTTDEP